MTRMDTELRMPEHTKAWKQLAMAFYDLAHGDFKRFEALPSSLKEGEVGQICQQYMMSRESGLLDRAGKLLTGSKDWYVYLGRTF